jgi:hypothetical protein
MSGIAGMNSHAHSEQPQPAHALSFDPNQLAGSFLALMKHTALTSGHGNSTPSKWCDSAKSVGVLVLTTYINASAAIAASG